MKNNNFNTSLKRGRPPKKDYDPEALMRELIDTAAEIYQEKREIKATALELDLPPGKVDYSGALWFFRNYPFLI